MQQKIYQYLKDTVKHSSSSFSSSYYYYYLLYKWWDERFNFVNDPEIKWKWTSMAKRWQE